MIQETRFIHALLLEQVYTRPITSLKQVHNKLVRVECVRQHIEVAIKLGIIHLSYLFSLLSSLSLALSRSLSLSLSLASELFALSRLGL